MTSIVSSSGGHDLQVNGRKSFQQNRWREAILYYLFRIWSEDEYVTHAPRIYFGFNARTMCLRLNKISGEYYAYGDSLDLDVPQDLGGELLITKGCAHYEVEGALARFVKNDDTKMLVITFGEGRFLRLWKTDRRGEYGCNGTVPRKADDWS